MTSGEECTLRSGDISSSGMPIEAALAHVQRVGNSLHAVKRDCWRQLPDTTPEEIDMMLSKYNPEAYPLFPLSLLTETNDPSVYALCHTTEGDCLVRVLRAESLRAFLGSFDFFGSSYILNRIISPIIVAPALLFCTNDNGSHIPRA